MYMKVNGKMKKEMEEESNNGRMAQFMRVTGKIISPLAMEGSFTLMAMFLLDVG